MFRSVSNPERGCGSLKEGGFYGRGDMGAGGMLKAWSWVLGQHVIDGDNLTVTVPPRQMQLIKLPETLATRRIVLINDELSIEFPRHNGDPLTDLPKYALLDHVGSSFYTPYGFFSEIVREGPSRRIPRDIARQIAPLCPIPILFTHSWLPMVADDAVDMTHLWAGAESTIEPLFEPTFEQAGWGLYRNSDIGSDHWIIDVMEKMHLFSNGKNDVHLTKIMPPVLAENILTTEQIFGASWITRCVYITTGEEDPETITSIYEDGIEPVTIIE